MSDQPMSVSMLKFSRVGFLLAHPVWWGCVRYGMQDVPTSPENVPVAWFFVAIGVAMWAFGWRWMATPGPLYGQHAFTFRNVGAQLVSQGGMLLAMFTGAHGWVTPFVALGFALSLFTPVPEPSTLDGLIDDAAPIEL